MANWGKGLFFTFLSEHKKIGIPCVFKGFLYRAADGNRTRDLRTTNATLYRLSHSSIVGLLSQRMLVYQTAGGLSTIYFKIFYKITKI